MRRRSALPRRLANQWVTGLSAGSATVGLLFLAWILVEVVRRGFSSLSVDFFTQLPTPPGIEGGGLSAALVGTLIMTGLATVIGVPLGLMVGVYLAEFGKRGRFAEIVRFHLNVLMGVPSIIIGLFVYGLLVLPMGRFSGYAGALALAFIMLPVVGRTTEDMLVLVPNDLRESALALGSPRWKVTLGVVFRAARKGLATGGLLAVARVSGETAPLLFTALNSPYWPESLGKPTANVTVTIFNYAMSPYADWQGMAWAASLVITLAVLGVTLLARWFLREAKR